MILRTDRLVRRDVFFFFQVGRQHVGGDAGGGAGRGGVRLQRAAVDGPGAVRRRLRRGDPGGAPAGGRRGLPLPRRQAVPGPAAVAGALARPLRDRLGPLRGPQGPLRSHARPWAGPGDFPQDGHLRCCCRVLDDVTVIGGDATHSRSLAEEYRLMSS